MKRYVILILFSIAMGASRAGASDSLFDARERQVVSDLLSEVFTDRYENALIICDSIIAADPDDPAGHFFRAYALMAAMTEEHDESRREALFRSLDSVESLVGKIIDTCRTDRKAWCYWYLGNVWAYRALWKGRFGSPAAAFKLATRARKQYQAGLDCDSMLYDNYAGLGAVHYWKSAKGGFFRSLGIIRDDRAKGIAELKIAAESSVLSRETAQKTLITILNDYEEYDSAIAYAERMLEQYPDGRSFLWGISRAYYSKGDFSRACEYYLKLRTNLAKRPGNYYKLVECDAQITRCLERLKRLADAREWAIRVMGYLPFISDEVRDKQKDNIEYLTDMVRR